MHTSLTHRSQSGLSRLLSRQSVSLWGNELTRNSSGNTRLQSSQFAEPLWTDPGLKHGISLHELISVGNELSNILLKSSHARKKPPLAQHLCFLSVICSICAITTVSATLLPHHYCTTTTPLIHIKSVRLWVLIDPRHRDCAPQIIQFLYLPS